MTPLVTAAGICPSAAGRAKRGFTLVEMIAAMVVMGILVTVGAFAFNEVQKSERDSVGKTLLGVAQVEGRRVASANGYTFPADLADQLKARTPAPSAAGQFKFTTGTSYAPQTVLNTTPAWWVSVATAGPNVVAYTVQTTTDGGDGHCWAMVEDLSDMTGDPTRWGYSTTTPLTGCSAVTVAACATAVTGTVDHPSAFGDLRSCTTTQP